MAYSTELANLISNSAGALAAWAAAYPAYSEAEQKISMAVVLANANRANSGVETLITTRTVTAAESGMTFFLNLAGGFTVTLPAAAAGLRYTFIAKTAPTTAYIILSATADTMIGWPLNCGGADSVADGNAAGDQVNFAANVALAGDRVEVVSDGTSWHVFATAKAINAITITG